MIYGLIIGIITLLVLAIGMVATGVLIIGMVFGV